MLKKLISIIVCTSLWGGATFAQCNTSNTCQQVLIERLYSRVYGYTLIATDGDETNLACVPAFGIYLKLYHTQQGVADEFDENIFAMLLTAQASQEPVTLITKQSSGGECVVEGAYLGN